MHIMFLIFFLLSVVCLSYVCIDLSMILSITSNSINGMYWNFLFSSDYIVLLIFLMLFICFGFAYYYTNHYFSNSVEGSNLNSLVCLFVFVMASLVVTGDFLSTLIMWEYLGVVSFFLILFYLNYLSLRASIVTLVSSRFGDVCLFVLVTVSAYSVINYWIIVLLFGLVILTKSASFPFTSWLLEAMRAPTPVSSLVHSSTLVAAGVWFSLRYDINFYNVNNTPILTILVVTIFITGVCCFFYFDLKKIVALSTCNNIAWCLLYLLLGDVCLCLFQLLSHGVSKCLLFMLVGDVMSGSGGSQSCNCVYSAQLYNSWGVFSLFCVVLGLSGAPFIGVFFTKHLFVSMFCSIINLPLLSLIMFCIFLSYIYSFRLCRVLYNINVSAVSGVIFCFSSGFMVYFWLFVNFLLSNIIEESSYVSNYSSSLLIAFQIFSCLLAYFCYSSNFLSQWSSSLWGCDNLVELCVEFYNKSLSLLILFFYRWDNYVLCLFGHQGVSTVNLYKNNLLNLSLFSLIIFILMCFVIV